MFHLVMSYCFERVINQYHKMYFLSSTGSCKKCFSLINAMYSLCNMSTVAGSILFTTLHSKNLTLCIDFNKSS